MKKVLQVSKYMYPFIGGTEQVARDVADALNDNEEIQQKIICFNEDAADGDYICQRGETVRDTVDGIEVIRCGCIAKIASQSLSRTYPRELKKVLRDFSPDIVILHYPNPFVSVFLLKMMKRDVKFVLYWHLDITKQKVLGKLFHRQTMQLLKRADVIVATSPNYIEGSPYLKIHENKCKVIPNCIDTRRLSVNEYVEEKAEGIRSTYSGKTICLAIGRHVPYKGMDRLIEASKYLNDSFVILIGGNGPLTDELEEAAKNDKKIHFLGRVDDKDLAAYYIACDIFVFPSITKNEAFGIALAEGMYFGKPAVTFTIPGSGVNFVNLDGVTGVECPNRDARAYAEALEILGTDEALRKRYGRKAYQRVTNEFIKDKFEKNTTLLINGLIKE